MSWLDDGVAVARDAARNVAARAPWLVDGYRLARNPRQELRIRRDAAEFARDWAFVSGARPTAADGPVVLFALWRDDIYEAKTAVMLAAGVAMAGTGVAFSVPSRRYRHSADLLARSGLGPVHFVEDLMPDGAWADAEVDRLVDAVGSPGRLHRALGLTCAGYEIGVLAVSSLIRHTQGEAPDLDGGDDRAALARLLRTAVVNYRRYELLLDRIDACAVVLHEPGYVDMGPLVDVAVARDIDAIEIGPAKRDDALLFMRLRKGARRVLPQAVSRTTFERVVQRPWTELDEQHLQDEFENRYGGKWELQRLYSPAAGDQPTSREDVLAALDLPDDRKLAIVFAHVLWDATHWGGEDLYDSYTDWLVAVAEAAAHNDEVSWVVKAHPANIFRHAHGDIGVQCAEMELIQATFPELPPNLRVIPPDSNLTALSLYRAGDYGLTVRGAPGYEMACFGKPVLTAGTGTFAGLGFTYDSDTREELVERIAKLHTYGPIPDEMTERAKRYALTMLRNRPWRIQSFRNVFEFAHEGWDPLDRNLVPIAHSLDDIRSNGDLTRFTNWLLLDDTPDYVEDPDDAPGGPGPTGLTA